MVSFLINHHEHGYKGTRAKLLIGGFKQARDSADTPEDIVALIAQYWDPNYEKDEYYDEQDGYYGCDARFKVYLSMLMTPAAIKNEYEDAVIMEPFFIEWKGDKIQWICCSYHHNKCDNINNKYADTDWTNQPMNGVNPMFRHG